jgi:MFS family permease
MRAAAERVSNGWSGRVRFRQLSLLTFVALSGMYARALVGPIQVALQASLSLSSNLIAFLQGPALALPLIVLSVPLGSLVDRHSRRGILIAATLGNAGATIVGGFAPSFVTFLATRCFVGLCAPATAVAAFSILSDLYPVENRGRASTVLLLGQIAGTASAFVAGGELLSLFGGRPDCWREVLLVSGCSMLIPAGFALGIGEPARAEQGSTGRSLRSLGGELWEHRVVLAVLVVGMAMVNLADGAALVWTAPTLSSTFAFATNRAAAVTGITIFVGGVAGPLMGGPLADWCQRTAGPKRTVSLIAFLALLSAATGLFAIFPDPDVSVCLLIAFLGLGSAISVAVIALSIIVIPNELRGTCITLEYGAGAIFGLGLAPMMVSAIAGELAGPSAIAPALAWVCAVTCLFGAVIFISQRRRFTTGDPRQPA